MIAIIVTVLVVIKLFMYRGWIFILHNLGLRSTATVRTHNLPPHQDLHNVSLGRTPPGLGRPRAAGSRSALLPLHGLQTGGQGTWGRSDPQGLSRRQDSQRVRGRTQLHVRTVTVSFLQYLHFSARSY